MDVFGGICVVRNLVLQSEHNEALVQYLFHWSKNIITYTYQVEKNYIDQNIEWVCKRLQLVAEGCFKSKSSKSARLCSFTNGHY